MVLEYSQPKPAARAELCISIQSAKTENKNQEQQNSILALQEVGKHRKKSQLGQDQLTERDRAQRVQRLPQEQRDHEEQAQVQKVPEHKGLRIRQECQWHENQGFKRRADIGQRPVPYVRIS